MAMINISAPGFGATVIGNAKQLEALRGLIGKCQPKTSEAWALVIKEWERNDKTASSSA